MPPGAPQAAQGSKTRLPTWETRVPPLGRGDALEKEMATHSRILAGESRGERILGLWPMGSQSRSRLSSGAQEQQARLLTVSDRFSSKAFLAPGSGLVEAM